MTYNHRPAPQRTYPDQLEQPYNKPHSHGYGYDSAEQGFDNSGRDRRGQRRYPESYDPREDPYGYGQGRVQHGFGQYGPNRDRRFRDATRGGQRPHPRRPPEAPVDQGGYGYPAHRGRGQQRSDLRPPWNGHHHAPNLPYRNNEQVQTYQQPQYEPAQSCYGDLSTIEADHQYQEALYDPRNAQVRAPQSNVHQHLSEPERYDMPPPSRNHMDPPTERASQPNVNHHLGEPERYDMPPSAINHMDLPIQRAEVSSLRSPRMQSAVVRPVKRDDNERQIPPPSKVEIVSPDSLAWDNPFPTFPPKPKQRSSDMKSLNDSMDRTNLGEQQMSNQSNDGRPHSATSRSRQSSRSARDVSDGGGVQNGTRLRLGEIPDSHSDRDSQQSGHLDPQAFSQRGEGQHGGHLKSNDEGRKAQLRAPITGRHSEDSRSGPIPATNSLLDSDYERSRTLPNAVTESIDSLQRRPLPNSQPTWQAPGALAGHQGPEEKIYLPEKHLQYGSISNGEGQSHRGQSDRGNAMPQSVLDPRSPPQDGGISDFFDQYYYPTDQARSPNHGRVTLPQEASLEEDMPNFDAASDADGDRNQGLTMENHLGSQRPPPDLRDPTTPYPGSNQREAYKPMQGRSQADLRNGRPLRPDLDTGFDFGVAGSTSRRPGTAVSQGEHGPRIYSSAGNIDRGQPRRPSPGTYADSRPLPNRAQLPDQHARNASPVSLQSGAQQDRFRSPPLQSNQMRYTGGGPPPISRTEPPAPPPKLNPDALPRHPPPIRPGLAEGTSPNPPNQPPKPAPIRQYNASPSPMQLSSKRSPTPSGTSNSKESSGPVTPQELEVLRQKASANPNDQATQLLLAKKFVEAASVLVNERADTRTRNKDRERYITDAHRIVKKLSSNGYLEATFYLADAYSRGALGLEADMREAFGLYQTAAKAGHAQAAYRVAVCCEIGQEEGGGTRRDAVKAMQWYKRAATLGDTPAMYKMGIIQLKGLLGQPMNPKEAIEWLKKAADRADKENPHALHELGLLYEEKSAGNGALSKDGEASRQLFTQAANLGYKFSQFRLGCAYEYGLMGCIVDPRQSIAWYSKAAVQEEHQSELALSGWYLTGSEGVLQQSDTEAYLWARKAAQAGLAKAEYAMGYFTEVGIGAPANLEDAKRWYWRSASQNFPKARDRLEDLRKGGATKQKTRVSRSNMKKQSDGECIIM